jgi:hypothetical protein
MPRRERPWVGPPARGRSPLTRVWTGDARSWGHCCIEPKCASEASNLEALLHGRAGGCVNVFMQLVGIHEALHQGGPVGARGLAQPRSLGSDPQRDWAVPAQALGVDGARCSAGRRSAGPAQDDRGRRSAASQGTRYGRFAPTALRRRWRWAPARVSPARWCPPSGTHRRTHGRTSCPDRG